MAPHWSYLELELELGQVLGLGLELGQVPAQAIAMATTIATLYFMVWCSKWGQAWRSGSGSRRFRKAKAKVGQLLEASVTHLPIADCRLPIAVVGRRYATSPRPCVCSVQHTHMIFMHISTRLVLVPYCLYGAYRYSSTRIHARARVS